MTCHGESHPAPGDDALLYSALVQATRDYVNRNGFPGALLGMSGGLTLRWWRPSPRMPWVPRVSGGVDAIALHAGHVE